MTKKHEICLKLTKGVMNGIMIIIRIFGGKGTVGE